MNEYTKMIGLAIKTDCFNSLDLLYLCGKIILEYKSNLEHVTLFCAFTSRPRKNWKWERNRSHQVLHIFNIAFFSSII